MRVSRQGDVRLVSLRLRPQKERLDLMRELMDPDHQETQFTLLIPRTEFMKEDRAHQGLRGRGVLGDPRRDLPPRYQLALRPTSETAILPDLQALGEKPRRPTPEDIPDRQYLPVRDEAYATALKAPGDHLPSRRPTPSTILEEAAEQVEAALTIYAEFYAAWPYPSSSRGGPLGQVSWVGLLHRLEHGDAGGRTLQIGTAHSWGRTSPHTMGSPSRTEAGEQEFATRPATASPRGDRCAHIGTRRRPGARPPLVGGSSPGGHRPDPLQGLGEDLEVSREIKAKLAVAGTRVASTRATSGLEPSSTSGR